MATPLENVVAKLPGDNDTGTWRGIPLSCHVASLIWIHHAEFGSLPNGINEIPALVRANAILKTVKDSGKKVTAAWGQVVEFEPGSVVVFYDKAGNAGHSCVMESSTMIFGYNQANWFKTDGVMNCFSTHLTSDLNWIGQPPHDTVRRTLNGNHDYMLSVTPGGVACAIYRSMAG